MDEQVYTNHRLQLPDGEVLGTLVVRDGRIADIQPGISAVGEDGRGDYLLPGLVELHTDNFERSLSPRPGVRWPAAQALVFHDREMLGAGITTVLDAVSLGDIVEGSLRLTHSEPLLDEIARLRAEGRFLADHRLHLRCELSYAPLPDIVRKHAGSASLISLMDHSPGQRQFAKIEKYKEYYSGKHGVAASDMDAFIERRLAEQRRHCSENRAKVVQIAKSAGVVLASHDDTTLEHVAESVADGVRVAEFPTTLEAAAASHEQGLSVLMGAPNVVLGKSHSGNVSAMQLAKRGLLDVLSSDYVPQSLVQAIFFLARATERPLHETMRVATSNAARAVGLDGDRGSLEIGKRADVIAVHEDGETCRVMAVIAGGRRCA